MNLTAPAIPAAPAIPERVPAPGLRDAFRVLLEHLGSHVELLRIETGTELARLGGMMGYWFALALTVQLGLVLGLAVLVATHWQSQHRDLAVVASAALLLAMVLFCYWQIRRLGRQSAQRFSVSSQQWQRDIDLIREML